MIKKNIQKNKVKSKLTLEIRELIVQTRTLFNNSVNAAMSRLYWQIGKRLNDEISKQKRSETYGQEIVGNLCKELAMEYGTAFSEKNIRRMMQFAKTFQDEKIVVSLIRQLSWTHLLAIIPIEDSLKRDFYIELCKHEKWSVRTFRDRINSMLYERTAISKKPDEIIKKEIEQLKSKNNISSDLIFRDPYVLDFLGLKEIYSEKDIESAILIELQKFIIELGSDFAFLDRQKRISIDNEDYYIDLLFYHRRLKCLIAVELKLGKFEAAHKGQMELYLRWLEKHECIEGENPPIGLILCASKNKEHIVLLQTEKSNIKVAEYLTKLPDLKILEKKLHYAIENARNKFENKA
jgi:predicted nuclease of restriction endonuclease-like (RecB) superfamily